MANWIENDGATVYSNVGDRSMTYVDSAGNAVTYRGGYPNFKPYLYSGSDGAGEVTIELTPGRYDLDFQNANAAAGFLKTPDGFTWHHNEKAGLMQLVDTIIHRHFKHYGGVYTNKH